MFAYLIFSPQCRHNYVGRASAHFVSRKCQGLGQWKTCQGSRCEVEKKWVTGEREGKEKVPF